MFERLLLCIVAVLFTAGASEAMFLDAKDARKSPRGRLGSRPCRRIGTHFLHPEHLGPHGYSFEFWEKNGIVYTCKAGFLDIAHVRGAIDRTAFIATKIFHNLKKQKNEFEFKLAEPSIYYVQIVPSKSWKILSQNEKEAIARDISIKLGQYIAHTACIWHEILTWFGYKSTGFFPEYHSAFSCEDTFSDLLGTYIGVIALRDMEQPFDQAVTLALDRELKRLGVQNKCMAVRSTRIVEGHWFSSGFLFIDTKRRNFDIGLRDGLITPWIVPTASECKSEKARLYEVPSPEFLSEYGFNLKFEIEPREWEKDKILKIVYPSVGDSRKRLEPLIHFPAIMDYIRKDAVKKYGPYVSSKWYDLDDGQTARQLSLQQSQAILPPASSSGQLADWKK